MNDKFLHIVLLLFIVIEPQSLYAQDAHVQRSNKITEVHQSIDQKQDSILNKYQSKLDSLQHAATGYLDHTNDSIGHLQQKYLGKMNHYIDSLNAKLDDLKKYSDLPEQQKQKMEQKILQRLDSATQMAFEKLRIDKIKELDQFTDVDAKDKLGISALDKVDVGETLENLQPDQLQGFGNPLSELNQQVNEQLGNVEQYTVLNSYLNKVQAPGEVNEALEVIEDPSQIDQQIERYGREIEELKALEEHGSRAMEKLPDEQTIKLDAMEDMEQVKKAAKLKAVQTARKAFQGKEAKVVEALEQVSKLKKKYAVMPNSKDLSTAKKHSSLKDQPLKKRLVFGCNFQLHRGNPMSLDLAPTILYRFSRNLNAGFSGTYRAKLGIDDQFSNAVTESVYGFSGLGQHKIYKGFFGQLELQYMSVPLKDITTLSDAIPKEWSEGLLLGIGKKMKLSNVFNGQIILSYDFLHNDQSANAKAWSIRFGINVGKVKLKELGF